MMRAGRPVRDHRQRTNHAKKSLGISILFGLLSLSGILWLSVGPALLTSRCGLIQPHDHLLLGDASASDLAAHLSAEAACVSGHGQLSSLSLGYSRTVISIARIEPVSPLSIDVLSLAGLAIAIPALLAHGALRPSRGWSISGPQLVCRLRIPPAVDPPPRPGLKLSANIA